MAGGHATREIASRYPVTDGITARTTTQQGHQENLIAEESMVLERNTKLMRK